MRTFFCCFALAAFLGTGTCMTAAAAPLNAVTLDCEHCKKDHKCDDKCKKGGEGKCCKARSAEKAAACADKKHSSRCCKAKAKAEAKATDDNGTAAEKDKADSKTRSAAEKDE